MAKYLLDREGQWIPGYELETKEIGGQGALQRFRSLRAEWGRDIFQSRPMIGSKAWEYRVVNPDKAE